MFSKFDAFKIMALWQRTMKASDSFLLKSQLLLSRDMFLLLWYATNEARSKLIFICIDELVT